MQKMNAREVGSRKEKTPVFITLDNLFHSLLASFVIIKFLVLNFRVVGIDLEFLVAGLLAGLTRKREVNLHVLQVEIIFFFKS